MKLFIATITLLLASCAAQESTLTPPNRQLPSLDPSLGLVSGVEAAPIPDTTPVFKPKPVPPNRKRPVITKADVVMAMSDKLGILVDTLAKRLATDVENALASPAEESSQGQEKLPSSSMDGQLSIRRLIEEDLGEGGFDELDSYPSERPSGSAESSWP